MKLGRGKQTDSTNRMSEISAAGGLTVQSKSEARVTLPLETRDRITRLLMERVNIEAASQVDKEELVKEIEEAVGQIANENRIQLNAEEQRALARMISDDMVGVGPLQQLLSDDSVTDILVNGSKKVFVERFGKLELTDLEFRDDEHLKAVCQRIARSIGRRVDDSSPMVDARLPDGSRVNIVFPPISLEGPLISIRRFARHQITLDTMVRYGTIDDKIRAFLELAGAARLNILISGGTSTGKTTMLNAISRSIDQRERILVIEDASELQLQQPHVVRLETRPLTVEGHHEITQRDLVKNALRMRPDRIILGEVRQGEAFDMLQAMNTGHDGSMGTLHANSPRDALVRLENMVMMAGFELPMRAIRIQMANAVDLIVQIERMRDGVRRMTRVTEITGIEGDVIATQDLFSFEMDTNAGTPDKVVGEFVASKIRPRVADKIRFYGMESQLMNIMKQSGMNTSGFR